VAVNWLPHCRRSRTTSSRQKEFIDGLSSFLLSVPRFKLIIGESNRNAGITILSNNVHGLSEKANSLMFAMSVGADVSTPPHGFNLSHSLAFKWSKSQPKSKRQSASKQ
jgi:hypothetical protein